jgi:hypothetical protein
MRRPAARWWRTCARPSGGPEQLDAALPVASLDKIALKKELDAIGQQPD